MLLPTLRKCSAILVMLAAGGCSSQAPTAPSASAGGSLAATERRVDAVRGDTNIFIPNAFVTLRTASGDTLILHCGLSTPPLRVIGCLSTGGTGRLEGATVFETRFTLQSVSESEMQLSTELQIPQLDGHVYAFAGNLAGGTLTSSTPECGTLNDVKMTGTLEQLGRVTVTFAYCAAP